LFRCRIGGYIKVFGPHAQHQVSNGTADDKGSVTSLLQAFDGSVGSRGDQLAVDAYSAGLVNLRVVGAGLAMPMGVSRRQSGQGSKKLFNHGAKGIRPRALPKPKNRPALGLGMRQQGGVWVGGHRVGHLGQKGQVVE
jgi:hypothetical protein